MRKMFKHMTFDLSPSNVIPAILCIAVLIVFQLWLMPNTATAEQNRVTKFVMDQEGFRSEPYDLGGVWHIGYGTVIDGPHAMGPITKTEAARLLDARLYEDRLKLCKLIYEFDELPMEVQIATQSAYYNCPALVGPIYRRYLLAEDWDKASCELAWGHDPGDYMGLVIRRVREANLIRKAFNYHPLPTPETMEAFKQRKKEWYQYGTAY